MPTTPLWYRAATRVALPLVPHLLREPRQRAAHEARLGAALRLARWGALARDRNRPLAWFHAPSVGEGLQARAVIEAFRRALPETQLVYTHFSPSAATFAATVPADFRDYLPYDRPGDIQQVLDALEPDLLVFTKLDLWPELATRAASDGVRVAMVAGTVAPASSRMHWPARVATRGGYRALAWAGAVSSGDAARLTRLGCPADRIEVTGDPRVDSVLGLVDAVPGNDPLRGVADPEVTLVAGSTWPGDERVLLTAFAQVRRTFDRARLILVPHEPTGGHLDAVEAVARDAGLEPAVRLTQLPANATPSLLLVDTLGALARLYAAGGIAYVGGGWGRKGIHSVLEPAAWGRPVIIGPHDRGSRDAELLHNAGALVRLPTRGDAAAALAKQWIHWLDDAEARLVAGEAARAALERERGAAERNAAGLVALLTS